jgi:hypothetical protein
MFVAVARYSFQLNSDVFNIFYEDRFVPVVVD